MPGAPARCSHANGTGRGRQRYNAGVTTFDMVRLLGRRVAAVLLFVVIGISVSAAEPEALLERSRQLESSALSLLAEQYRFEEGLLSPDNDRLAVFLSVPHGARLIINQVYLKIDGQTVLDYRYSATELLNFQRGAAQLIYAGRIAPGRHTIRLDVKTMQGVVQPMKEYVFTKEDSPKFVSVQIAGYQVREVFAVDW